LTAPRSLPGGMAVISMATRRLSTSDIERLADIAEIPPDRLDTFGEDLLLLLNSDIEKAYRPIRARDVTQPLTLIADLACELEKLLLALDDGSRAILHIAVFTGTERGRPIRHNLKTDRDQSKHFAREAAMLHALCMAGIEEAKRRFITRGGPRKPLATFIHNLFLVVVWRNGGKLRQGETKRGNLIPLLDNLRKFLPRDFLPKKETGSYGRWIAEAKAIYMKPRMQAKQT
jgi:hypothetical protein